MKVVVTGATGLIGQQLVAALKGSDCSITVLTRGSERARNLLGSDVTAVEWLSEAAIAPVEVLDGADAIVNLAGERVDQRWSSAAKTRIKNSRVQATANLVRGIGKTSVKPKTLLSASAIGIYGPRTSEPVDESSDLGDDFLSEVCKLWESEALAAESLGTRVVLLRTGIVLSNTGGALKRMLPPFKLGVGGPIGLGRHYMSWIHVEDQVGLILAALSDDSYRGPVNATAPHPVTNRDFARALGKTLHRPAVLPTPKVALRLAFGELSEILTTGARVLPTRALENSYRFSFPEIEGALDELLA